MRSCAIQVHKHSVEAILLQQCREVTAVILSIMPWLPTYMGQSLIRCNRLTAALADSSAFILPLTRPNPIPNNSLHPLSAWQKKSYQKNKGKGQKEKYPRVGLVLLTLYPGTSSPSLSSSTLALPDDTLHPTRVSSKNPTTAPTASSFHRHLKASALGCSHLQSLPTLCHKVLI